MNDIPASLYRLDRALVMDGFRQLVPISLFVLVFALAFGLAAAQTGLDQTTILAMSALVFAGASQFAALELWGEKVPLVPLLMTVFAISPAFADGCFPVSLAGPVTAGQTLRCHVGGQ